MVTRWAFECQCFMTIFNTSYRRAASRLHSDGRIAGIWTNWRHLGIFFFPLVQGFHKALFVKCIFKLYLKGGQKTFVYQGLEKLLGLNLVGNALNLVENALELGRKCAELGRKCAQTKVWSKVGKIFTGLFSGGEPIHCRQYGKM